LAVAVLAIVLAVTAPSQAAGVGGHGFGGGHPGGAAVHNGFDGHHFDGHHFEGRHFDRRFGVGPVFPYYGYYPYYGYSPGYWYYYCPSYGDYYPNVTSCPEAWVPVPAS
jgi:hypothetical protein